MLLVAKGHLKVDEVRRGIEYLESETYAKASYYEKWASSICSALLEHQLLSNAELGVELGADDSEAKPRFAVGDVVRVRESGHACRWRRPHLRTPGFVHGVCGTVERSLGSFANPEQLAFGGQAWTKCPLYLVRFDAKSIQDFDAGEVGEDQVTVEIYQSWLENADLQELEQQRKKRRETAKATIARALVAAVQKKGIVGADELRQSIERLDEGDRNRGAAGRKVVARAWVVPWFKVRLIADANSACAELGLNAVNPTAPTQLVVFEQTPKVHHLIVCTLCSCYPLPLLGLSPDWYKSREYRSRAVREPRKVLKEFGTELPQEVQVVVHDSTADCRYMILPQRPRGTEDWSEEKLQEIITRASMIGVTVLPEAV
eukprot:g33211.t1